MNTTTHLIAAAALLAKPGARVRNRWVLAGAALPDLWMIAFFAWASGVEGLPQAEVWGEAYWTEPWQTIGAVFNSVPFACTLVVLGLSVRAKGAAELSGWAVFGLAMLLHLALDLPVHADDAHCHFWPLTDFRFYSPVSYWDPRAMGWLGRLVELFVLLAAGGVVWLRFKTRWVRALVAFSVALGALFAGLQGAAALGWL